MKTLTAFCDLKFTPISYDFGVFLIRAAMERDARGCDGLHVVLVPYEEGLGGFARQWGEHDEAATRWRLRHIVVPMVALAGATVTLAADERMAGWLLEQAEELGWWPKGRAHLAGPLVDAARKGAKVPKLRATDAARRYVAQWLKDVSVPVVTLTTRNQTTHPDRNSDVKAWAELGNWLEASGKYHVIGLLDSNAALGNDLGCWAELDVDLRLALYERSSMNLIGNNGPATLLWFSDAPFMQFGFGLPAEKWTAHMAEHVSLKPGQQLPWARVDQQLVWKPDSFDVMRGEFEQWERKSGLATA